jgi:streptomycin 6-kinase
VSVKSAGNPPNPLLGEYLERWNLSEASVLEETPSSFLYRVKSEGNFAVLKILTPIGKRAEALGAEALRYFGGNGAVSLLVADSGAQLLEFVSGESLAEFVLDGQDDEATKAICEVLRKIHSVSGKTPPGISSVREKFASLFARAKSEPGDSETRDAANVAERLIETEKNQVFLHGDVHHGNILNHAKRGWVLIDPQPAFGESTYDTANCFYNPNRFAERVETSERIQSMAEIFAADLGISRTRVLEFAFAFGHLSAAWAIEDGVDPSRRLRIAKMIREVLAAVE